MRRLRVLCFSPYPEEGASVRHRICAYRRYWKEAGIELTVQAFMTPSFFQNRRRFGPSATAMKMLTFALCTLRLAARLLCVGRFDAIIIHREVFPLGYPWAEKLVARINPRIIYDVDDAIWHPPTNPVHQRRFLWSEARTPIVLKLSRFVVVGSDALRDYTSRFNPQVTVIPTTYDDLGEPDYGQRENRTEPVLVWIGNWGNAHYLLPVIPVLEDLSKRFRFRLRLIGGPDIEKIRSRTVPIDYVPWRRDREAHDLKSADIGLMPLLNGAYEHGKCAFKLIQYFSAGLAVVASPVGMNAQVIRSGENGFLASTYEEWRAAIESLLSDAPRRLLMGARSRKIFTEHFTRRRHADHWAGLLREVSQRG